ncbi:MAG: cytochrome ubiquinol oxidase subunit I [Marinilabiliales bacterium]|nr:cytochrome ubiquinol oxidase subunit I [Marinilabiliales bacterium]
MRQDFTDNYFRYFGYSYFEHPWQVIPSVPVTFYSFRIMVGLGFFFILLFILAIFFHRAETLEQNRWFLWIALFSIPLAYLASELGWIVTEMGRQPWIIQNLMPVSVAVSNISAGCGADHLLALRRPLHRPAHSRGIHYDKTDQNRTKTSGGENHDTDDFTRIPAGLLVDDNITACRSSRFPDVRSGRTVVYLFPAAQ